MFSWVRKSCISVTLLLFTVVYYVHLGIAKEAASADILRPNADPTSDLSPHEPPDPCLNSRTLCESSPPSSNQHHATPGTGHVLVKRSVDQVPSDSSEADEYHQGKLLDPTLQVVARDRSREYGGRLSHGGHLGLQNRPSKIRPIWNVPFRTFYGGEKKAFKFGKRSFAEGGNWEEDPESDQQWVGEEEQRPGEEEEKRLIKFGKRISGFEDGADDNDDDANDGKHDGAQLLSAHAPEEKRRFKFGKKAATSEDAYLRSRSTGNDGGSKRRFKFGKKSNKNGALDGSDLTDEEKRKIMFGKRNADGDLVDEDSPKKSDLSEDGTQQMNEEKRKPKFQFGKRLDEIYPYGSPTKLRSKFKLGK